MVPVDDSLDVVAGHGSCEVLQALMQRPVEGQDWKDGPPGERHHVGGVKAYNVDTVGRKMKDYMVTPCLEVGSGGSSKGKK